MAGYKKQMKPNTNYGLLKIFILLIALAVVLVWQDNPAQAQGLTSDLTEMSLEELMNIEITSVSKKEEKLFKSAAAVYVITQEDIRRSGVTSIPEALRMAPGLEVARINASKWAISSRGFNQYYANKLLVLTDGRSVYTPLFSGVFWDVQDTMLEDIDRIEVIRGPGATLWGANAVNGVINIITKSAEDTQGGLITAGAGTEEKGFGGIRYGGKLGEDAYYRVYIKYFDRDSLGENTYNRIYPDVTDRGSYYDVAAGDAADDWDVLRGGFRIDWYISDTDSLTVQGDVYDGNVGQTSTVLSLLPPFTWTIDEDSDISGGNLLARWNRTFSDTSDMALQFYYDQTSREWAILGETHDTYDVDFQHRFALSSRQEIVWGLGYRLTTDDIDNTFTNSYDPDNRDDDLYSAFIQDEIKIIEDKLRFTVGSKFEYNDYTGAEIQPGVRLLWTPREEHTVWASVARAVRTPSRSEHDVRLKRQVMPQDTLYPGSPVALVSLFGNESYESEEVTAYEAGYRVLPTENFTLDIAAFYNVYDNLRSGEPGEPFMELTPPPPHMVFPIYGANKLEGETYGIEMVADWQVVRWLRLTAGYTYLQMQLRVDEDSGDTFSEIAEGENPHNQLTLRSTMDLSHNLELDIITRYVGDLPSFDVDSYVTCDVRLGWRPRKNIEISIVGQNLIDNLHHEFIETMYLDTPIAEVERSVYGKITWEF